MNPILRSQLYVPATNPGMVQNSPHMGADGIIMDLEDAVAMHEKDSARILAAHALQAVPFGKVYRIVRVNGHDTPYLEADLETVVPAAPDAIRLPKVDSPDTVRLVDALITRIEQGAGLPVGTVRIHAMLETALGVVRAFEIASSSPRIEAISLGGQDLAADMGILRTSEGQELFVARGQVVLAARAAGVMSFDTPFTDINDMEGLAREARFDMQIGFTGKAAIHPLQVAVINASYAPDEKTLKKAVAIVRGSREALAKGLGVYTVNGVMVDGPVVDQAESVVARAKLAGMEGVEDL